MNARTVLVIWAVTAAGGIGLLALARIRAGHVPKRLGAPGGVLGLHGGLALAGLAGWAALVFSDRADTDVPWIIPALGAVVVVALGLGMMWRAHHSQLHEEVLEEFHDTPLLDHVPAALRYGHGALGLVTAVGAVWVALR
ncbi:MAG: hypothetical protein ACXIVQ_11135 [Acidimicrobiales bacterium]